MINRSLKSGLWMLILKSGSFFVGLSYKFRIWSTWLWHFIAKLVQRRSLNFDAKIWIHWSLGPPNFRRASIWKYSLAWNPPNQISSNWQDRQWYPAADLKLIWWLHCSQIVCKNVAFLGNDNSKCNFEFGSAVYGLYLELAQPVVGFNIGLCTKIINYANQVIDCVIGKPKLCLLSHL